MPAARRRRLAAVLRGTTCCAFALLPLADAAALSIGRVQGSPLLGRALQVAVPVAFHPGEQLACVRGELQQPDTAPAALDVRIEAIGEGQALLRLSSSALVVEPVVTVKVVVGCQDQLTHSYVLLADPPPQRAVLPVLPVAAAATASVPVARVAEAARAPAAQPQARSAAADPVRRPAARPAKPVPAKAKAAKPPARTVPPPAPRTQVTASPAPSKPSGTTQAKPPSGAASGMPSAAAQSRLEVDLLDLPADPAPALKPTGEMSPPPVSELTRPETAPARDGLQAALDPQAAAAKEAAVQAELRKLREQLERQSAQLQALNDERELTRTLAAGIAAALALALGALLWRRSHAPAGQRRWWQASRPDASATSALPSSLFPSWAPESAAADSLPAPAALAAQAAATPAEERTQVMSATELAAAIQSVAPPAPPPPAVEELSRVKELSHPDLDLDFSSLHAERAAVVQPEVLADLDAGEAALQVPALATEPAPEPTPTPHEIDWEAPVLPGLGETSTEVAAAPTPAAAPEAPMLPELDFGNFGAGAADTLAVAAAPVEAPVAAKADDNSLDFDLDLDLPASTGADARPKA